MKEQNTYHEKTNLIVRYLSGEATAQDIRELKEWLEQDSSHQKEFLELRKAWDYTGEMAASRFINVNAEWSVFEKRIQSAETKQEIITLKPQHRGFSFYLLRVAAIAVILILSAVGINELIIKQNSQKIATVTEIKENKLPDGTLVTLNTHSTLKYPVRFKKNIRHVKLVGEAYFTVVPDTSTPFIIDAGKVEIRVLGTSFYVNAPENSDSVEVIVHTGKVSVYRKTNKNDMVILEAGDKAGFSQTEQTIAKAVNNDINYLSWKTKKIIFNNDKLSYIINTLNKVYQSNITIEAHELKDCTITATFDNQSLDAVLNVLKATLDIAIDKQNDVIRIKGKGC